MAAGRRRRPGPARAPPPPARPPPPGASPPPRAAPPAGAGVPARGGARAGGGVGPGGGGAPRVRTTVLDGALALVPHRLAVATAGGARDGPPSAGGWPPFPTADGEWVELEAVAFESWAGLFRSLGAAEPDGGAGWGEFARRYLPGPRGLPPAPHDPTRPRPPAAPPRPPAAHGA